VLQLNLSNYVLKDAMQQPTASIQKQVSGMTVSIRKATMLSSVLIIGVIELHHAWTDVAILSTGVWIDVTKLVTSAMVEALVLTDL
jgi:hypothetical protein